MSDIPARRAERDARLAARYAQLLHALADVPLSDDERRTLQWLAGWEETHTVENICSVIRKARTIGPIEGQS